MNFVIFQSAQLLYGKREESQSGSGSASGFVLVTNGSECGSGRPKNIRIRIRINTVGSGSVVRKASIKADPKTPELTHLFKTSVVEMGEGT